MNLYSNKSAKQKLRVLRSSLKVVDGKLRAGTKLFTGVVYDVKSGYVLSAKDVVSGVVKGDYYNELLAPPRNTTFVTADCVDLEGLDDYYNHGATQLKFKGKPFKGVLMEFVKSAVTSEVLFVDGWPTVEIERFNDGSVFVYDNLTVDSGGRFYFYETGALSGFSVVRAKDVRLGVNINEDKRVSEISIKGDFFSTPEPQGQTLPFGSMTVVEEFFKFKGSKELKMSGQGLDDSFVKQLFDKGFFEGVEKLSFFDTLITPKVVDIWGLIRKLRAIRVYDHNGKLAKKLITLKKARPEIRVEYTFSMLRK